MRTNDRLNVAATGTIPGDSMQRAVTLVNNGDQNLTGLTLTTTATTSSMLDTDATNGLQLQIDELSGARGLKPARPRRSPTRARRYAYHCPASRGVVGSNLPLPSTRRP